MREFSTLDSFDWLQIQAAANGRVSGTLAEWPRLKEALDKCGIVLSLQTTAESLRWAAEAAYWQARADDFSVIASDANQALHDQQKEVESLRTEIAQLREAFKLEAAYAARPEIPPPELLGGPQDLPE